MRCIEASARGASPPPATSAAQPAAPAPGGRPGRPAGTEPPRGATVPLPTPTATPEPPPFPPEDCTGRVDNELRRCLAAGGRLQPSAAGVPVAPTTPPPAASAAPESCDGKSGDALRLCIELTAKSPLKQTADRAVPCTRYTAADQPLCVHRNSAIIECQNRKKYPDFDVCMRSHMARAPEPKIADCRGVPAHAKGHCESRNRTYRSCVGDRIGYFACLEKHLGTDAMLTRR